MKPISVARPARIGIIGAGIFAEANHFPAISSHGLADQIERVSVCDRDPARAAGLASRYGWSGTYTDPEAMLDGESLDAVIVCVGGRAHPALVELVLKRGLPVFVEKPTSTDLEGTLRMSRAAEAADLPVQVGHQKRHGLQYRRFLDMVRDRESFGELLQIESKQLGFGVFPTFFTCMLEWQCHNLDFIRALGGHVVEVEARSRLLSVNEGSLMALLRFESGALATLSWGTFGGPGAWCERIEAVGSEGNGAVIENARDVYAFDSASRRQWSPDWNPISANQSHVVNGYVPQLQSFVECLRTGREPEPSIHDEAETMTVLFQIAHSAGIPTDWGPVASAP